MRLLRVLLLGFLALVLLLGGGGMLAWWLGGATAQRWVVGYVLETALNREVRIEGAVSLELGMEPSLSLTEVQIDNASWATEPVLLRVARADVQMALRPLLDGVLLFPRVALDGVEAHLETAEDGRNNWEPEARATGAPAGGESTGSAGQPVTLPLIADLSLSDARLTYVDQRDGERGDLQIDSLHGRGDTTTGEMTIDADGDVNGNAWRIHGEAGRLETALSTAPYPIAVDLTLPDATARLEGTITDLTGAQTLDLTLTAQSSSIRAAVQAWKYDLPLDAKATATAKLTGGLAGPGLSDVEAEIEGAGEHLHLTGSVADAWRGAGIDARVTLSADAEGQLSQWLPEDWRILDRLEVSSSATGSIDALVLDDLSVSMTGAGATSLDARGKAALAVAGSFALESFDLSAEMALAEPADLDQRLGFPLSDLGPLKGSATLSLADQTVAIEASKIEAPAFGPLEIEGQGELGTLDGDLRLDVRPNIALSAKMADSTPLAALTDEAVAMLGPIDVAGRLVRGAQGYRLDDMNVTLGAADRLSFAAEGSVGPLMPDDPQSTPLDLAVHFDWPTIRVLDPQIDETLPDLGRAHGEFGLTGTLESLRVDAARLQTERSDGVQVTATGGIATIEPDPLKIEGAAFDLDARAPSTTAVAGLFGDPAPDLGPVRGQAKLAYEGGVMALSGLDVTAGPTGEPRAEVSGGIGDLLAFQKVDLDGTFAIPTSTLLAWGNVRGKTEVGRLHGTIRVSDAQGRVGVEHVEAEIRETNLLSLTMAGAIDDLAALDKVRFETTLEVPNLAELADVFDSDATGLERFRFEGKLSGDDQRFDAEGKASLGNTDFSGELVGNFAGIRPRFEGSLVSPLLRLDDLGLSPKTAQDLATTSNGRAGNRRLFGTEAIPLQPLRDFDLNLFVAIDKIEGIEIDITHASASVVLDDGALRLSPLKFLFVGGHAEVDAEVDVREAPVTWSVSAEADDVNLGHLWAQLRTEVPVAGDLDLIADLKARGDTPQALAASLDGDVSLAVQDGQLLTSMLGLTTMSPLSWLVANSTRRGYSTIDCFVLRLKATEGVAKVGALLLDTPNVIVKGAGTIDLGREKIDLQFNPKPKHGRIANLTTPFAITGRLADPSVDVSTAGTVARAIGEVVLSPVNLLGSLLPFVNSGKKRNNPCLDL